MTHEHTSGCGCDHHVFATPVSRGLRIIPRAPFRAWVGTDPAWLEVEHDSTEGPRCARVRADGGDRYTWEVDEATSSLEEVLDVIAGPALECGWWIEAPFV